MQSKITNRHVICYGIATIIAILAVVAFHMNFTALYNLTNATMTPQIFAHQAMLVMHEHIGARVVGYIMLAIATFVVTVEIGENFNKE